MNESKTVFTRVYLAGVTEVDSHNKNIRGNEELRDTILWALSYAQKVQRM